jgi:protein SCO1
MGDPNRAHRDQSEGLNASPAKRKAFAGRSGKTNMSKQSNNDTPPAALGASRKALLLALLIGLAAGVLTAVLLAVVPEGSAPTSTAGQTATGRAMIGGPFTLTDGSGKAVTEKDFAGKPMLVFFGFTNCPDVCPAGLQVLAAALDRLGDKAEGVTPLFITVDPERDTPELVGKYVKSFHPRIVGLSGTPEQVADVIKAYRVYAKKQPSEGSATDYSMDHSSFFYLMDASGGYVKHFPHSVDAAKLADDVAAQIQSADQPPKL